MKIILLISLISILSFQYVNSTVTTIVNNCFDIPLAQTCIRVTSQDCDQLTGSITVNGAPLYEETIPIGQLLQYYQDSLAYNNNTLESNVCKTFNELTWQCSLCSTATDMKIQQNSLHYCGYLTVTCDSTSGQHYTRKIQPDCVDIQNCGVFECRNNCNGAGTCSSLGMCQCNPGHYGLDCSVLIKDNCIQSNDFEKTCWTTQFPDCNTVSYEVSTPLGIVASGSTATRGGSFSILPCQRFASPDINCETCVTAENLSVTNNELMGSPTVIINCDGTEVTKYSLPAVTLTKSDKLICPSPPGQTGTNSTFGIDDKETTLPVLWFFVGALVLFGILGISYFVYTKWDCAPYKTENYFDEENDNVLRDDLDESSIN